MNNSKDGDRMPRQFQVTESIDSSGKRVIVYQFFESSTRPKQRRPMKRDSFIKVTFDGSSADRFKSRAPAERPREGEMHFSRGPNPGKGI